MLRETSTARSRSSPFAFHFVVGVAPARSRQTNDDESEDEKEKDETRKMRRPRFTVPASCGKQTRGDKLLQLLRAELLGAREEKRQRRKHEQAPKPDGRSESHERGKCLQRRRAIAMPA